jgi:hypothetical protein
MVVDQIRGLFLRSQAIRRWSLQGSLILGGVVAAWTSAVQFR